MIKSLNITLISMSILILFGCNKNKLSDDPSLSELETFVKEDQDHRAIYTFDQYKEILDEFTKEKYIVLPLNKMKDSINVNKVIIGLRHDVDCHPFKAITMAQIENSYGFSSTYYMLSTAKYYGKFDSNGVNRFSCMDNIYKELYNLNHEIGIHNDLLTVMIDYNLDPFEFNHDELAYYTSLEIPVTGSAAHGSTIASRTVSNNQMFSDFAKQDGVTYEGKYYEIGKYSLKEYGFEYEAYFINYNIYYSEPGGNWNFGGGLPQLFENLEKSVPGDRIEILIHPVWWGK